ncbi:hypothetical protein QFZ74_003089 [Streptomyces sp. V3I7]|nr:hypothetical protein [Streptomyces sp. V3I7]
MESVEREVRWLNELIESERAGRDLRGSASEESAQHDTSSGATGGLPRPGNPQGTDTPDDTAT